jgi:hypothetical protein
MEMKSLAAIKAQYGTKYYPFISGNEVSQWPQFFIFGARVVDTDFGERCVLEVAREPDGDIYTLFLGSNNQRKAIVSAFQSEPGLVIGPVKMRKRGRVWVIYDANEDSASTVESASENREPSPLF